jgi:D-glycero-D-manno-heptose 1,7-bisphosphate phosphatase
MDNKKKTIFLDRDGTLIEEVNFLSRLDELKLFPFTYSAINLLKSAGFQLIAITNQSGIARGIYTEDAMHAIHEQIQIELDHAIDAFYFCPHLPDAGCLCRKPALQMIRNADEAFGVDFSKSWVIGDKALDVETGIAGSMNSALVRTGYGAEHEKLLLQQPEIIADNVFEAAKEIVAREK